MPPLAPACSATPRKVTLTFNSSPLGMIHASLRYMAGCCLCVTTPGGEINSLWMRRTFSSMKTPVAEEGEE